MKETSLQLTLNDYLDEIKRIEEEKKLLEQKIEETKQNEEKAELEAKNQELQQEHTEMKGVAQELYDGMYRLSKTAAIESDVSKTRSILPLQEYTCAMVAYTGVNKDLDRMDGAMLLKMNDVINGEARSKEWAGLYMRTGVLHTQTNIIEAVPKCEPAVKELLDINDKIQKQLDDIGVPKLTDENFDKETRAQVLASEVVNKKAVAEELHEIFKVQEEQYYSNAKASAIVGEAIKNYADGMLTAAQKDAGNKSEVTEAEIPDKAVISSIEQTTEQVIENDENDTYDISDDR